jgi:selenoprotein W-related protein
LTAKLLPRFKRGVTQLVLIPSTGGCFEVTVGGKLLYSKLETGSFPDEETLLESIGQALGE